MNRIVIIPVAGILLLMSGYFVFTNLQPKNDQGSGRVQSTKSEVTPELTPTPFPFQEMTIPYLRRQKFTSTMTQLETVSSMPRYTAYRASYMSDGNTVYGLLTVPKSEKPPNGWSAVIFLHGYIPPTQYRTTEQYSAYTDYLSRSGFVVFKPDFRGHDRSEGEPGGAYYSADYVVDTLNAYAAVSALGYVNPRGVGIWGHSMSGNVALRVMAIRQTIPAVVIWAGAVYTYEDMQSYGIQDGSYRPPVNNTERQKKRQMLRDAHGDFSADSPFWKQVAVTDYLKDIKGSLQLHHAINDDVVSVEYSRNLIALLDATSVPHTFFEYPSGGHNISGVSFNTAMERTVEFFTENLAK